MDTLDQAKHLQDRTKAFAVRIIKSFARLPKNEAARIMGGSFFAWELLLPLTIEPRVVPAPRLTSFRKSAWWPKKRMKLSSGSNCWQKLNRSKRTWSAADERVQGIPKNLFSIARDCKAKSLNH